MLVMEGHESFYGFIFSKIFSSRKVKEFFKIFQPVLFVYLSPSLINHKSHITF